VRIYYFEYRILIIGKGFIMKKVFILFAMAATLVVCFYADASEQSNYPEPVQWTAQQDHQNMMEQLGIKELRRGADGMNPSSPYYQNTDESKANPYPNLPDPLVLKNGEKVTTPQIWREKRRPEIVEDFDSQVYGRVPQNVPKVTWEVTDTNQGETAGIPTIIKQLVGHVDNSSYPLITVDIQLTLTTPANSTGPVPIMMEFGFSFGRGFGGRRGGTRGATAPRSGNTGTEANLGTPANQFAAAMASGEGTNRDGQAARRGGTTGTRRFGGFGGMSGGGPGWQQQLLEKGWGYAVVVPTSVQADNGAGLTKGIIGLCNKGQPRKPEDWGALRAWAWAASKALDYFETDKDVNAKQVGITGLSRYGKAALVAMAYDRRFAIGFIGSSGEGGAKLSRRNWGELVENLTGSGEYHWMCGNFLKYGGPLNAGDLPVDSHELIAMCAPRPTFISYGASEGPGAEGTWVDQKGSFMAEVAAGPVYELLGKKGLGTDVFPPVDTALIDGDLAWRQHSGGHTTGPNWPTFLRFAERYIKAPPMKK
jgi:hypothetical protein